MLQQPNPFAEREYHACSFLGSVDSEASSDKEHGIAVMRSTSRRVWYLSPRMPGACVAAAGTCVVET